MVGAEGDPFLGELRIRTQQGQETGGEGGDPACGFGAHDPFCGDFKSTHIQDGMSIQVIQDLIQDGGVDTFSSGHQFPVFFLSQPQGMDIFIQRDIRKHKQISFRGKSNFSRII